MPLKLSASVFPAKLLWQRDNELCQSSKSRMLRSHALAFFSALHTRFSTLLAVVRLMLRTFLATCPADLCTKGTELFGVITSTAHQRGGQRTDVRAVTVKLDASSHHFHVILAQASSGARFANQGTVRASLDAGSEH
tara:strand:- start:90 stop:500 length:411 start_codon:yes stop_codon:yes gene_type:complete